MEHKKARELVHEAFEYTSDRFLGEIEYKCKQLTTDKFNEEINKAVDFLNDFYKSPIGDNKIYKFSNKSKNFLFNDYDIIDWANQKDVSIAINNTIKKQMETFYNFMYKKMVEDHVKEISKIVKEKVSI